MAEVWDRTVGENLAITGAIKDGILDTENIASLLCGRLRNIAPEMLCTRYKLTRDDISEEKNDYEILEAIGRRRGFLVSGGDVNTERTSVMLLEEFRNGKIGRISLEKP